MSRVLGEAKLELSRDRGELSRDQGDLSAFEVARSRLESEVHDLTVRCKDYEKKIVDACESVELVFRSHVNNISSQTSSKAKFF